MRSSQILGRTLKKGASKIMQDSNVVMLEEAMFFSRSQKLAAWLVHAFTASGAIFGLWALWAIHEGNAIRAFWLMAISVIIDSVDGLLARRARTKEAAPKIDGALLDNITDYFTYVIVAAFFILGFNLLPPVWNFIAITLMMLASAYQFTQPDAKTEDHFFKGFPSYWNIVVFYLFFWQLSLWSNLLIILLLSVMVFVPIKYVYPSRLKYLSPNPWLRKGMLLATLLWGFATAAMLMVYPESNPLLVAVSMGYGILYFVVSLYRTFVPVNPALINGENDEDDDD